jgi:hypothetical protein
VLEPIIKKQIDTLIECCNKTYEEQNENLMKWYDKMINNTRKIRLYVLKTKNCSNILSKIRLKLEDTDFINKLNSQYPDLLPIKNGKVINL